MNAPIDRRAALGGLVAGAGALLAVPKLAKAVEASAVSRAYAAFQAAHAAQEGAWDAYDDACDRYEAPELPDWHPVEGGAHVTVTCADGARRVKLCCSDESLADRRETLAAQIAWHDQCGFEDMSLVDRIRRTLEKIEAYRAERQHRRDALGLDRLETARDEADAKLTAAAEAALTLEPASIADLAMQANVLLRSLLDDEGLTLKRFVRFADLVVIHAQRA